MAKMCPNGDKFLCWKWANVENEIEELENGTRRAEARE
jgi:hypothetical protein